MTDAAILAACVDFIRNLPKEQCVKAARAYVDAHKAAHLRVLRDNSTNQERPTIELCREAGAIAFRDALLDFAFSVASGIPNVNPETGIPYGVVSLNNLQDWVWEEFINKGQLLSDTEGEEGEEDCFIEEPEYLLKLEDEGLELQLGWLGGAPLVWVLKSPHKASVVQCSPCVPNAGDLDSETDGGYECYTLPPEWFYNREEEEVQ